MILCTRDEQGDDWGGFLYRESLKSLITKVCRNAAAKLKVHGPQQLYLLLLHGVKAAGDTKLTLVIQAGANWAATGYGLYRHVVLVARLLPCSLVCSHNSPGPLFGTLMAQ